MKGVLLVPAHDLAAAVKYTARWLNARPAIPEHGGLLFMASEGRLHVHGLNENVTAGATVELTDGEAEGGFVVSGRLFDQLVATFPDKPVRIQQDGPAVYIDAGAWHGSLPIMPERNYPQLPDLAPPIGTVAGDALANAARRVGAAANRDLTKDIPLTGVHLSFGAAGTLTLTATDRYRGAQERIDWEPDDEAPAGIASLVLASTVLDVADALAGADTVEIGWDQGVLSFVTPERSLVTRTLDDKTFPASGLAHIFEAEGTAKVTLPIKPLALPLKRAEIIREKATPAVALRLTEGQMTVHTAGELNSSAETITVEYDGPDTEIRLLSPILQGALHSAPGDSITMSFVPGTNKPAVITSAAEPNWRGVLVPLKSTTPERSTR